MLPLLLLLLPLLAGAELDPPLACTQDNTCYRGAWLPVTQPANTTHTFAAFQGIRYAEPPLGERRFLPAVPVPAQPGETIDLSKESTVECPQADFLGRQVQQQSLPISLSPYVPHTCLIILTNLNNECSCMSNDKFINFFQHISRRQITL